jgi:predicted kinase
MTQPGTLYFFTGKMAAGKSTLAASLVQACDAVLLGEDELLLALFPNQISDVQSYVSFSGKIKTALFAHLRDLLRKGVSIVLDFPANTLEQRAWMRQLIDESGALHELHYIQCSDELCKTQLAARALQHPERVATDTPEVFDAITKYFQAPDKDENFNIVYHVRT